VARQEPATGVIIQSVIRRALAHLLIFSLCLFNLEVVAVDVHDDSDSDAVPAVQIASVSQVTASAGTSGAPADHAPVNHDSGPTHLHACHCTHSHSSATATPSASREIDDGSHGDVPFVALAPSLVDLDVSVRPPIA
jgi:hypothetical protein